MPFIEKRLAEAKKLGFDLAIGPIVKNNKNSMYEGVRDIRSALNTYLGKD